MRKWFSVVLAATLVVLGITVFKASLSSSFSTTDNTIGQRQSQAIAAMHANDTPVASPAIKDMHNDSVVTATVTYGSADGMPFTGYLAHPDGAAADYPGIIVIQEWWGLNDNIRAMTEQLAAAGYTALAVDLYDGKVAETPEQARVLVQAAIDNATRLQQNVVAAYTYLDEAIAVPSVGSIGWCFGGTWSLNTALALPEQLDAAVIYYGGGITTDPAQLVTLQMPIQGHFGALDSRPSPETVQEFEAVLNELGKSAQIYLYEGADHAFANPSGTRYDAEAAELAWTRTLEFFASHLGR
ncbi:MAG: dienelactone hydrolase family protein [Cyanothece sp. SIO2G6]|nr:dienelactone hydrolase family protein [Cyanothece sp. SIO2G6]